MNPVRNKLIILQAPKCPDAKIPFCKWCGEEIQYVEGVKWQTRQRTWHRGDKLELKVDGVKRNCRREMKLAMCWSARDALRWQAMRKAESVGVTEYILICVDCDQPVEIGEARASKRAGFHRHHVQQVEPWHADHEIPIVDGGLHALENFRCRCVPCHKTKTAAEAGARARVIADLDLEIS